MDLLLIFGEWLDVGLTAAGLAILAALYQERSLIADLLWWTRESRRLDALEHALTVAQMANNPETQEVLAALSQDWRYPIGRFADHLSHLTESHISYNQETLGKDE